MAPSRAKESKSSGLKLHSPPSCPKARPAAPKSWAATDLGESSESPGTVRGRVSASAGATWHGEG